jgi:hypothetical protein
MINDICIVGDSYADVNGDDSKSSWPNLLAKEVNSHYVIDAQCGISNWVIYKKFRKAMFKKDYSAVVFCHTNPMRWPSLPAELKNSHWMINDDFSAIEHVPNKNLLTTLNKYYFDIFPNQFSQYISESIFRDVNEYCDKNNIYLINIMCFNTPYSCETKFPILHDIDWVSQHEQIKYQDKFYTFRTLDKKHPLPQGDPRICHLGDKNNARLASILKQWLIEKPLNIQVTAAVDFTWETHDESNDALFYTALN